MDTCGSIPNENKLILNPITPIDLLASWYEAGLKARQTIKQTLMARRQHRSYETYLFGSTGQIKPYRMNGATHGMSLSEMYVAWRTSVLETLRSAAIPKYLMLKFTTAPDVLIEQSFEMASRDEQLHRALTSFDRALATLLDIIKNLPPPRAPGLAQENATTLPPVDAAPLYRLRADMEDRRLIIHAGSHKLISKHRLAYNGNPHKLLRTMIQRKGQELTKEQVGLPANLKLSNVVLGIGFKGIIHRKLVDSGYHTVMLRDGVLIDDRELHELLASCQESFDVH